MTTPKAAIRPKDERDDLQARALRLGLYGLLAHWDKVVSQPWIPKLLDVEEHERGRRSLERRIRNAKLGRFKPMVDFDWKWPKEIDHEQVDELFRFEFVTEAINVILAGPNGIGKTMIARNLAHQAILRGHTVRCLTASELLNDLASQESSAALLRRLRHYSRPELLVIDEVGYLATSSEHADLLFEIVTRRYEHRPIILTTNRPFKEWSEVFPNATCVVTLIDRLIHRSEIVKIDGESYRLKEARERSKERKAKRSRRTRKKKT
jgi:DNA replication protein DnaC